MKKLTVLSLFVLLLTTTTVSAQEVGQFAVIDSVKIRNIENTISEEIITKLNAPQVVVEDSIPAAKKKNKNVFVAIYRYFADANIDKTYKKKIDFSIIGGPHYAKETGFSIGIMASGLYRTDKTDPLHQPSNMSIFGDISLTNGFYLLGIRGNHYFPGGKHKLEYTGYTFSFPSGFWGLGYENGYGSIPGTYKRAENFTKVGYAYKITKNLEVGGNLGLNWVKGTKWSPEALKLLYELPGNPQKEYLTIGLGFTLSYDSRDFILNPTKGINFRFEQRVYPRFLGNGKENQFGSSEVFFNFYQKLWKGAVMAYELHFLFTYGNTPWTQYATSGGSYRMRGYYEGRFRDRNGIDTQLELRQTIWKRIGATAWIGGGNVFPSFAEFKWNQCLPNYGVGLRWEFKNRVNLRFDWGWGLKDAFGRRQSAFIFNINEAF